MVVFKKVSCYAKPARKTHHKTPLDERRYGPLSSVQSLYKCKAELHHVRA